MGITCLCRFRVLLPKSELSLTRAGLAEAREAVEELWQKVAGSNDRPKQITQVQAMGSSRQD